MEEIIRVHYPEMETNLMNQAMDAFYWIRGLREIQKKPSTSELLDWIAALNLSGMPQEKIQAELPFAGVLLKKNQDVDAMRMIKEKGSRR